MGEDVLVKADKLTNDESEQNINRGDNESKEDKDLREILKAKSSLNNASTKNEKSVLNDDANNKDYDSSVHLKNNEQEDSIDIHVDSEYEEMVGSSDKEGRKASRSEKQSDSGSDDKSSK